MSAMSRSLRMIRLCSRPISSVDRGTHIGLPKTTSHRLNGMGIWNRSQLPNVHFQLRQNETGTMGSWVICAKEITPGCGS